MDKKIKTLWLTALRSGEYKQGEGQLRCCGNTYCCLGVLCDVSEHDKDDGDGWAQVKGSDDWAFGSSDATLSKAHLDAVGLSSGEEAQLVEMNDEHGQTFEEIADWIEENL